MMLYRKYKTVDKNVISTEKVEINQVRKFKLDKYRERNNKKPNKEKEKHVC